VNADKGGEDALDLAGYEQVRDEQRRLRRDGRCLGVGVAAYAWRAGFPGTGMGMPDDRAAFRGEAASVRVEWSGGVTVRTDAMPHGQGRATALTAIVCGKLGVPPGDVSVAYGDTEATPYDIGSEGSRGLVTAGSATWLAAERVWAKAAESRLTSSRPPRTTSSGRRTSCTCGVLHRVVSVYDLALIASHGTNRPPGMEPGLEASATFDPEDCT
jgi:carbon-monoxide dehydrogenase large subunit